MDCISHSYISNTKKEFNIDSRYILKFKIRPNDQKLVIQMYQGIFNVEMFESKVEMKYILSKWKVMIKKKNQI